MQNTDWTYIQAFVQIADAGSLSGASRATGISQPTLSRHLAALEAQMGLRLFDRQAKGLELTRTGLELLEHARAMAEAAARLSLIAEGASDLIEGTVRITASEMVAVYLLPPILTDLANEQPDIEIELVASNQTENLLKREADIAVRMYRPSQADVFTRKVADMRLGLVASQTYLQKHGMPTEMHELANHRFVGSDRIDMIQKGFKAAKTGVPDSAFSFRSDSQISAWEMVRSGFGFGIAPLFLAATDDQLRVMDTRDMIPDLPLWLTAHAELKTSRRIRFVYDFLAKGLATRLGRRDFDEGRR